jgi:predicted Fe-Mo cluster-binding NifX family protein
MKIAITAKGKDLEAEVDPRFGRAQYLILYDTDGDSFTAVDNSATANATHGAGVQAGQAIANSGATALITGNCGPRAFSILNNAGIKVYTGAEGTVKEAIEALKAGNLAPAGAPNVEGHW